MPKHRNAGNGSGNGSGGTPDWFFWTLAFVALVILAVTFIVW